MSEPFIGEIRAFGFPWAPRDWAKCDGQEIPINQNQVLFAIIGTMYGGDGRTCFQLPDLRGRAIMGVGYGHLQGQRGGSEKVQLSDSEMPHHSHLLNCLNTNADSDLGKNRLIANIEGEGNAFQTVPSDIRTMNAGSITDTGRNEAHSNMQPYLVVNFCIALQGLWPPRD
jgi:microcystin-dependent protein